MMKLAGMCVFASVVLIVQAQQPKPPTKKTTTVKTTVKKTPPKTTTVVVKKTPAKAVVVKKTTQTIKKTTIATTVVRHVKRARKVARRHGRRRHYIARRRSHHRVVIRTTTFGISSNAETGLVGVHLFDSGMKVLAMYGNPDMILSLGQGAPSGGGGGGAAGGGAPSFGGGGGGGRPGGGGVGGLKRGGAMAGQFGPSDFQFQNDTLDRQLPPSGGPPRGAGGPGSRLGGGAPGGFGGGAPGGFGGGGAGAQGFGGGGGGAAAGGASSAAAPPATYVRWVYKRENSQYSFIIDRQDRVVQIEAVGMDDPKVHTNRGVSFGATFKTLMDRYGNPDDYEISGDSLVLRYLSRSHVAFRLNRLETDKPHEVTAIVVAGGRG